MNSMIQPPAKPIAVQMARVFATSHSGGPAVAEFTVGPPMQALQRFPTGH
ncbi:MAG: hypothetical protein HYX67_09505 [Candidatus Melainabacteria bacterium]|nr:hypothetical protein [Candidatus Melainabacteria bacterium]